MKHFYFLFVAFTTLTVTAQIPESLITPKEDMIMFDEYEGTIYETLKYPVSTLIDENSSTYETRLRYNIYDDAIEFKNEKGTYQIVKNTSIHAKIGDDLYYYCEFKTQRGLSHNGYFVLIDQNNDYRVYKKFSLKITDPAKTSGSSFGGVVPGKIRQEVSYFLEHNSKLLEIPTNKNSFFALFDDRKTELNNFIKSEKLKLRKEEDLIVLMSKYNELILTNGQRLRTVLAAKME